MLVSKARRIEREMSASPNRRVRILRKREYRDKKESLSSKNPLWVIVEIWEREMGPSKESCLENGRARMTHGAWSVSGILPRMSVC